VFFEIKNGLLPTALLTPCVILLSDVVGHTTVQWIRATLKGHLAMATPNYSFRRVVASRGYLQGGVLSPLLWCLIVDEQIARLNRGGVRTQGHTDDICLLEAAKFPHTVLGLKQWILHTIETWCGEIGLLLNREKTARSIYKEKETSFLWTSFSLELLCTILYRSGILG